MTYVTKFGSYYLRKILRSLVSKTPVEANRTLETINYSELQINGTLKKNDSRLLLCES